MGVFEEMERKQNEEWERNNAIFQEQTRQKEQERHNIETERVQKLSGLSKDTFAIQEILLMATRNPKADFFQPSIHDLGFESDIYARIQLGQLLKSLQERGCFESAELAGNSNFTIKGPNIRCLKKELKRLKNIDSSLWERLLKSFSAGGISAINVTLGMIVAVLAIITGIQNLQVRELKEEVRVSKEQQTNACTGPIEGL